MIMSPTVELASPSRELPPIPEPPCPEFEPIAVTFEHITVISPTLEPSNPYPLPNPEPLVPVAQTVEFATVMAPTVEKS
jgi:hypothetical protein